MVAQGNFLLELVNASTMQPIPEHSSSTGKTFVTMTPNADFLLRLAALNGAEDNRSLSYKTFVSNNTNYMSGRPRHAFKRRLDSLSQQKVDTRVFRFDRNTASTQPYESIVMEKVIVRVYEDLAVSDRKEDLPLGQRHQRRKLLETIMIHCCVLPVRPLEEAPVANNAYFLPPTVPFESGKFHASGQKRATCWATQDIPVAARSQITPEKNCCRHLVL